MLLTQTRAPEAPLALRLSGINCPVELRRSRRATRFSLKVSHTERAAILTLPHQVCLEEAGDFLSRHMDWLKRQIDRLPKPVPLANGSVLPFRGQPHKVQFVGRIRNQGVVWVELASDAAAQLRTGPATHCNKFVADVQNFTHDTRDFPRICVSGDERHAPRRLADWLRSEAKADLVKRVEYYCDMLNCQAKRISVRDQATRWGSCSSNGTLCFSWRLIFAPSYVLDYVAAHEVAHLHEMNHGQRFWRLVRQAVPDMQRARYWLKHHGAELHRFGATL
jgi:hypothetical protein